MSGSPSTETSDLQETEFSISDHYDDDLSEDSVLITPFEVSTGTLGELSRGSSKDETIDPNSTCDDEEGDTSYAYLISHARVRAALKRPIRLCKFYGVPTCLMVLEIELFETKRTRQAPRLFRFKAVDVTVEFKDAAGMSKLGPEIVMFCPENYMGEPTVVTHSYSTTLGASIDASNALPVGPSVGLHRTHAEHFTKSCKSSITGRTLRMGSKTSIVRWEIKEDEALRQGVPKQLRFVMAVKNPAERAFNMKLNFSAYLGFNDVEFRVKKKQSVLSTRVDPVMLRERALTDENGPEFGRVWQCLADDADLTTIKLEELTNLEGSTVGRTSAFG
jgi:hypothetical protein